MAFEWANKTAKTRSTPAPDAARTREIELALKLNSNMETALRRFR